MTKVFNPKERVHKRTYLVDKLLAFGSMNNLLAQSGVGKTYLVLWLAVCAALGEPFLGLKVKKSRVLVIDQDEAEVDTHMRLAHFCKSLGVNEALPNLSVSCMEGLRLKDGSLAEAIAHSDANLVIIDSLTTVSSGLSLSNEDMRALKELYQSCVNEHRVILFLHHISDHKIVNVENLMTLDAGDLTMYSSIINQTSDANFILVNPNKGINLSELYMRTVMKRYRIGMSLCKFGMKQTEDEACFTELEEINIDAADLLTEDQKIVLAFFEDKQMEEWEYVDTIVSAMKGVIGINRTQTILKELKSKEYLKFSREGPNRFKYCQTEKGKQFHESHESHGFTASQTAETKKGGLV